MPATLTLCPSAPRAPPAAPPRHGRVPPPFTWLRELRPLPRPTNDVPALPASTGHPPSLFCVLNFPQAEIPSPYGEAVFFRTSATSSDSVIPLRPGRRTLRGDAGWQV